MSKFFVCTSNAGKLREFEAALASWGRVVGISEVEQALSQQFISPEENSKFFLGNALVKFFEAARFVKNFPDKLSILVDDSGLCVPALNYAPGVHSAYFGGFPTDAAKNRAALRQKIQEYLGTEQGKLPAAFVCFLVESELTPQLQDYVSKVSMPFHTDFFCESYLEQKELFLLKQLEEPTIEGKTLSLSIDVGEIFKNNSTLPRSVGRFNINVHFAVCFGMVSTEEQNLIPGAGHGYDAMFYPLAHPNLSFASVSLKEKERLSHRGLAIQQFVSQKFLR